MDGVAQVNGLEFTLDDFCYKPITGQPCLVESPMQYFKNNYDTLMTSDPKTVAQCIPEKDATERVCFDAIGTPVLTFAVFGGLTCEPGTGGECQACKIDASGLQVTFLLNKNEFSLMTSEEWERQVFIRNFKSFNYALNNGYHTDMDGPMDGIDYNYPLIDAVQAVVANYTGTADELIAVKADYLAERSIADNIVLESS